MSRFAARRAGVPPECCLHSAGQPIAAARFHPPWYSLATSDKCLRKFRAQHAGPDLGKRCVTAGRSVIAERRESAVVGSTKLLNRYVLRRFQYTVPHFFRGLNMGVDRSSDSHKNPLIGFSVFLNDLQ